MNPWSRVNLLLACVVAVLLAATLWPVQQPERMALTDLSGERIATLRVERGDRLAIELQRSDAGWQLRYPKDAAAEDRRVQQLLAIAQAPVRDHFPAGPDPARYGLQHPQAVLQLDGLRLLFGDRDPAQELRYVQVGGEIRVIDDVYFNLLTLPAQHFARD
jgi:hypothetical protein